MNVALITGANKGIGFETARLLGRRRMKVWLGARDVERGKEAEEKLAGEGIDGRFVHMDVTDPHSVVVAMEAIAAEDRRLDVLVNMASIYRQVPYDALTEADWEQVQRVDLWAAHFCTRRAVDHMRRQGGGRVICFTDWVAASGRPRYSGYVSYYVAKMGVIALVQTLALELASDNILVNAIAPGPIMAPPGTSAEEIEAVERATPLGRWGGADEIVKAVRFFIESDFVTGEVLRVDGGRHVK